MLGFLRSVRWLRRITFTVRRGRTRQQQEGGPPGRVAPGVGHHGAIPLVEDLLMTGLALAGAVFGLPVLMPWRRKGLRLCNHVGRSLGEPVGDIVQALLRRLAIDESSNA